MNAVYPLSQVETYHYLQCMKQVVTYIMWLCDHVDPVLMILVGFFLHYCRNMNLVVEINSIQRE